VPFIITQQVQPDFIIVVMQSQQAWIILQQSASPLVQVITHPLLVISTLHRPIVMLQAQQTTPLRMQQQVIIPPWSIRQRFWSIPIDAASSHEQVIFIPPSHFSILMEHRGTISQIVGTVIPGIGAIPPVIPGIIIPMRSIVIAPVMVLPPDWAQVLPKSPQN
jgi:hypothetical protein